MWIKNSLKKEANKNLMLQKRKFQHLHVGNNTTEYEDDGATIIRIIFSKCDPSEKSGINSLKSEP